MAVFTLQAKPLLMHIIFPVTIIATTGDCFVYRSQMTLLAWRGCMHSVQWETGHGVIETDLFTPAAR